jgi:hypothetical protein
MVGKLKLRFGLMARIGGWALLFGYFFILIDSKGGSIGGSTSFVFGMIVGGIFGGILYWLSLRK